MDNDVGCDAVLHCMRHRRCEVAFSQQYNRKPHRDDDLESTIETTWAQRRAENASLFNGTKFRFAGVVLERKVCTIRLGLTDYKTYLGTHFSVDAMRIWGPDCLAQPFGNVVIPETRDRMTVVLVRSGHTGESAGAIVFPGGHAEPDMVSNLQENDTRVKKELWDGARREVLEELWVGDDEVGKVEEMDVLGLVGRKSDGKMSMVFSVQIGLTGEQLVQRFGERNDGVESDKLMLVELDNISKMTSKQLDGRNVAVETRGATALWIAMKQVRRREP